MEKETTENKGIYLREINIPDLVSKLKKGWKYYLISLPLTFIVSAFIIFSVPRYYRCEVKLAPESSSPNVGNLGALASFMGMNIANMTNNDAIIPELYPDLVNSTDFLVSLFPIKVVSIDSQTNTTYFNYLNTKQKKAWWNELSAWISTKIKSNRKEDNIGSEKANPFRMTKKEKAIAKKISSNITTNIDKKTDVISIVVDDQDPLVAATLADSVRVKLQQFITNYRTKKAKIDYEYAKKLNAQAKILYQKAQAKYASYCDANEDATLQSFISKRDELENDMQLQFNNYQQTTAQMQAAKAKIQERTPAFTILQNASVPTTPAGPKRMIFVAIWLFIAFIATSVYVYKKNI